VGRKPINDDPPFHDALYVTLLPVTLLHTVLLQRYKRIAHIPGHFVPAGN